MIKKLIYNSQVNFFIRNLCYFFKALIPNNLRIPVSGIFKLKVEKNLNLKISTNQTSYISKQLFWEGSENYEYTPIFKSILKETKTFIDIGANFGYYSLLAAKLNKNIKVFAFEPSPGPFVYLKENIKINKLKNIEVFKLALSDFSGLLDFYEVRNRKYKNVPNLSGEHNTGSKKHLNTNKIKVKCEKLDSIFRGDDIEKIDLIKIDVEGSENQVIIGAIEIIRKVKPTIICEILEQKKAELIEKKLISLGYLIYVHHNNKLLKVDNIQVRNYIKKDFFFIHPKRIIE
ncbi:FkbM family methyltransferase [Psychroflexus salis]|uniref:Methyltransferase FkbM domain-containing protein n=1 Tax=Psychroflexus salis TaxID=1526574 RepID=A0A916ZZB0_9FLAO|nr:FkbM family methyltransferase [Psychroflexus salis]GGE19895.1 hypothetical protein GCM10010831_21280 [Psychroflexus salis]